MAESKWADADSGESKWGDRREEKQGEGAVAGRRAGKGAGGARAGPAPAHAHAAESKFADDGEAAAPASEETALVVATTVFGNDPIICKLVDFWGTSLSEDINCT
jgi:hypothetical protein